MNEDCIGNIFAILDDIDVETENQLQAKAHEDQGILLLDNLDKNFWPDRFNLIHMHLNFPFLY